MPRGRGWWRWGFPWFYPYYGATFRPPYWYLNPYFGAYGYPGYYPRPEDELRMLEDEARGLKDELSSIEARMQELKKQVKK